MVVFPSGVPMWDTAFDTCYDRDLHLLFAGASHLIVVQELHIPEKNGKCNLVVRSGEINSY